MQRIIGLVLVWVMLLCTFHSGVVFAEGETQGTVEMTEVSNAVKELGESMDTNPEVNIDEPEDAERSDQTNRYTIRQAPNGELLAVNITSRDVEIYVTDGYRAIPGAQVELCGEVLTSDSNGRALFLDVPAADEFFTVTVTSGEYGERKNDVLLTSTERISEENPEIRATKCTISYWTPQQDAMKIASEAPAAGLFSSGVWEYASAGTNDVQKMMLYDGNLYVIGESFNVYHPATNSWATLTDSVSGIHTTLYQGKIYVYSAWWTAAGDDAWDAAYVYRAYDIQTNTWSTLEESNSGGIFYDTATVCGAGIYYAGGGEVVYDMDTEQEYSGIARSSGSGISYIGNLSNGGGNTAVLCEEPGEYNNHIFYVDMYGDITIVDTATDEIIVRPSLEQANAWHAGQTASIVDGKIYYIGGEGAENSVAIYDIYHDSWSMGENTLGSRFNHSAVVHNGKIYLIGGEGADSCFEIYDPATNSSVRGENPDTNVIKDSAVVYNDRLYGVGADGELCIYNLPTSTHSSANQVAAGKNHVLMIENGVVKARGENAYGQLGNNTTTASVDFVTVAGISNGVNVAACGDTSYALTSDNKLYAWGNNSKGQVGNGTTTNQTTPTLVLENVCDIQAGIDHAVALKTDGSVWTWGDNTYGQLGTGTAGGIQRTPVQVYTRAYSIGAGGYHTLVIDQTNKLYAAGKNEKGQLGLGNTANQNQFVFVMDNISKAAGGTNHTAVLTRTGEVYTCGDNIACQLGRLVSKSTYSDTLMKITTASSIWAGANSTAYAQSGKLYQCGSGIRPGDGYFTEITGLNNLQSVALNKDCYAVSESGALYHWGLMSESDSLLTSVAGVLEPQKMKFDYRLADIDTYRSQALAIDENADVWAWGEGYYADGTDKMTTHYYPVRIGGISEAVQVSRGKNHSLVLDAYGSVWGFGSNSNNPMGALGGKVKTATRIPGINDVSMISAGTEFSIFLKSDGTLWGVGKNDSYQVKESADARYSTPVKLSDKSDFVKIVSGEYSSLALDSSGDIYSWGKNEKGNLGTGVSGIEVAAAGLNKITIDFTDGHSTKLIDIAMGESHCLALTDAGYVYSWGGNSMGQLGVGDKNGRNTPALVKTSASASLKNIKSISAGYRQSFAVTTDHQVYGFGSSSVYQLAINKTGTVQYATLVSALKDKAIDTVAAGDDVSIAFSGDGSVYSFGSINKGMLGVYSTDAAPDGSIRADYGWLRNYMTAYQEASGNIPLPDTAPNGSQIRWTSSNTYYLEATGAVNRPDVYADDVTVRLTAVLTNGGDSLTSRHTAKILHDPSKTPSTNIPVRSLGMEYDQLYPNSAPDVYPEITAVSMSVIDEANDVYQLTIRDDQFICSDKGKPFFFWNARQGTFLPVDGYNDYRSVRFTVDPDALGKQVKVVVGIGDGLGYIDRKTVLINSVDPDAADLAVEHENIVTLAMNDELDNLSKEEIGSGINLAIGVDTSANMLQFDPGSTKSHVDSLMGLIASVDNNTRLALVNKDNFSYPANKQSAEAALGLMTSADYTGETDALSLLERCDEALSNAESIPQNGNNAIIIAVQKVSDINLLHSKIKEIESKGTAVYIMLLSEETYDNSNQIIACKNPLKLRLNLSELYGALNSLAQVMRLESGGAASYHSDFRYGKHNFANVTSNYFGAYMAAILNIYNSLPAMTESYTLFDQPSDVYNIATGNASGVSEGAVGLLADFYQSMSSLYTQGTSSEIQSVINQNLRYRFPVIAETSEQTYLVTGISGGTCTAYTDSFEETTVNVADIQKVFDTYSYLLQTANSPAVVDHVSDSENFYENIYFTCPAAYTADHVAAIKYDTVNNPAKTVSTVELNSKKYYNISSLTEGDIILCGVKTVYNNHIPNLLNTTRIYRVIKYADLQNRQADPWYYPYLLKATNTEMIGGDTDEYVDGKYVENTGDNLYYNAQRDVTIAEFLKMLIVSADVSKDEIKAAVERQAPKLGDEILNHWAKDYICYALEKGIISIGNVTGDNSPDTAVPRCDVAYMITRAYIDDVNRPDVRIPSNLYKFDLKNTSSERNTLWNLGKAFKDQNEIEYCKDEIQQMYLNGVMDGDTSGYIRWASTITRAEATKMLVKCQFVLDEGLENVKIVNEGQANYIDFLKNDAHTITQANDKTGSGEFYFVAPRTGYYYISDVSNRTVTVYNEAHQEVTGIESTTPLGMKYPARAGEKIYIKTTGGASAYSFNVGLVKDNELNFIPQIGGKYIYSSNPERIEEPHLAESGNMLDNYENLSPGKYTYMAWYHNGVEYYLDNKLVFTPIYTDVLFNAMGSSQIRINKLGLQVFPDIDMPHWTGIQAYSDFIGQPIDNALETETAHNPLIFYPTDLDLPKQYSLSNQSVWLSDIYREAYGKNYPAMDNYSMPIYIIMEFEVLSGSPSLSTVAYKTTSDKTQLVLSDAPYVQDVIVSTQSSGSPTWKGISDFLPRQEASLYHTIKADTNTDNYVIPVRVTNTFGIQETSKWITNLNPQNDVNAYQYIPESSLLGFDYNDGYQWRFDTKRTSLKNPPVDYPDDGFTPNETLPFLTLPPGEVISSGYYSGLKKQQISISQGNYGVEQVYHLTLTNNTNSDWTFNYRTDTKPGTVVGISVDGDEMQYSCSGSFEDNSKYPRFVGRTVELPRAETVDVTVSVVLTTGDSGWVNNEFYMAKKY